MMGEVEFQDRYLQLGPLTMSTNEFFTVENAGLRPYNSLDNIQFLIRYEMSNSKRIVQRAIYGGLDWMGDIGGFYEATYFLSLLAIFIV